MEEERIKELSSKGLIIGNDRYYYDMVHKKYLEGVIELLSNIIDVDTINNSIDNCNLYFGESTLLNQKIGTKKIKSKYLFLLNELYVEKLSQDDLNILENEECQNQQVINIVKRTIKDVITKNNVTHITYGTARPETIIPNGNLVIMFATGKNTKKIIGDEYVNNMVQQKEFVDKLISEIETSIERETGIKCSIIKEKIV